MSIVQLERAQGDGVMKCRDCIYADIAYVEKFDLPECLNQLEKTCRWFKSTSDKEFEEFLRGRWVS